MARPIQMTKFKVYEQGLNDDGFVNKEINERAFFAQHPHAKAYEMLEPQRRHIATYAKGNIIDKDATLMKHFDDKMRVIDWKSKVARWRLFTQEGDLRGSYIRNMEQDNPYPGRNQMEFQIGLDVEWYGPNDYLIFEGFRELEIRITSQPEPRGSAYIYSAVLVTDNNAAYFPINEIPLGSRVMQTGSGIGEATVERGNISWVEGEAFVEFETNLSRHGFQMKVTDDAWYAQRHFRIKKMDEDGRPSKKEPGVIYSTLDAKFESNVNKMLDLSLTYGRKAGRYAGRFLDGITRNDIPKGAGFFEYMESAQIFDYDVEGGSIEQFTEFLPTFWNDKVDPFKREVDIWTGTGGLKLWNKWAKESDEVSFVKEEKTHYSYEDPIVPGRTAVGTNNKEYRVVHITPFGKVRINYMPFLDSELVDVRKYKGLPYPSYEFFIFNYGYGEGMDSNMFILNNKRYHQKTYAVGTWTPLGPAGVNGNGNKFANKSHNPMENAYYYIYEAMVGLVIKDPSAIIYYRPNFPY